MRRHSALPALTALVLIVAASACGDPVRPEQPAVSRPVSAVVASQPATISASQLSVGALHSCAIKLDGTLVCWGYPFENVLNVPAGTFKRLDGGRAFTCAIRTDDTLACWGSNLWQESTPPAGTFTQVSAGDGLGCAIKPDGTLGCWGDNMFGQRDHPSGTFLQVRAAQSYGIAPEYACGLRTDGTATCWGKHDSVTLPSGTYMQIGAGGGYDCGLRADGRLSCWGAFASAEPEPTGTFTQVDVGSLNRACAIRTDGTLACWKWGTMEESPISFVPPTGTFTQVSVGRLHACALRTDQTIACWGNNFWGQSTPPTLNSPPVADAGGPYAGTEGSAVALDWTASDANGDALSYSWDFGDGATGSGASLPTTHSYANDGAYTVTLTATDPSGATDTKSAAAEIANAPPIVNAGPDATITSGQSLSVSGSFSDAGVNDAPWAYAIEWGSGGAPSTGSSSNQAAAILASQQYLPAGTYTVRLSVTDKDGDTGSDALVLTVRRLSVSVDIKPGANPNSISLTDNGNGQIPVAILTTPALDARLVAPSSVQLGATAVSAKKNGSLFASLADVDGDGDTDLVVHFERAQLIANGDLTAATTSLTVIADLVDGRQVAGQDAVRIIP